jgi:hypothetical protein
VVVKVFIQHSEKLSAGQAICYGAIFYFYSSGKSALIFLSVS